MQLISSKKSCKLEGNWIYERTMTKKSSLVEPVQGDLPVTESRSCVRKMKFTFRVRLKSYQAGRTPLCKKEYEPAIGS